MTNEKDRKRKYKPGHRNPALKTTSARVYSEVRYAWAKVDIGSFMILVGNDSGETGQDIVMFHPRANTRPVSLSLTTLTEPELDALEELFITAFKWARPVVKIRDQEAQDEYNKGNDAVTRIYRQAPLLVFRKRPESEYDEELQQRSQDLPEGDGDGISPDGGVRGSGDAVAEPEPGEDPTEDDGPKADES